MTRKKINPFVVALILVGIYLLSQSGEQKLAGTSLIYDELTSDEQVNLAPLFTTPEYGKQEEKITGVHISDGVITLDEETNNLISGTVCEHSWPLNNYLTSGTSVEGVRGYDSDGYCLPSSIDFYVGSTHVTQVKIFTVQKLQNFITFDTNSNNAYKFKFWQKSTCNCRGIGAVLYENCETIELPIDDKYAVGDCGVMTEVGYGGGASCTYNENPMEDCCLVDQYNPGSHRVVLTWIKLPYPLEYCYYEARGEEVYTIYSALLDSDVFCIAGEEMVYNDNLYKCSEDGKSIIKSAPAFSIVSSIPLYHNYRDDINVNVQLEPSSTLLEVNNIRVYARLLKDESILLQKDGYTNSEGLISFKFDGLSVIEDVSVEITTTAFGLTQSKTLDTFINPPALDLTASMEPSYVHGEDIIVDVQLISSTIDISNVFVEGELYKDIGIIKESNAMTDSSGFATITFSNMDSLGYISAKITTTIQGITQSRTLTSYIEGLILNIVPTTESYIVSTFENITSFVKITDSTGRAVTSSEISNLQSISTITGGSITYSEVVYLGEGLYKIISSVTDYGLYTAKLSFTHMGVDYKSPGLQIDVRSTSLDIDVSKIEPVATINEEQIYEVSVFSSTGEYIEPDDLWVEIRYPSGFETETIPLSQINWVSKGTYSFSYTFSEIEKYTFNMYVTKDGYERGSALASISVTEPSGSGIGPTIPGGVGSINLLVIGSIIAGVFLLISLFRKKKVV